MAEEDDFERMKRFVSHCATLVFNIPPDSPIHPVNELQRIAREHGNGNVRKGLKMAANDLVAAFQNLDRPATQSLDDELAAIEAMTLSEARSLFSSSLRKILRHGRIATETDYYLAKDALDYLDGENTIICECALAAFEAKATKN